MQFNHLYISPVLVQRELHARQFLHAMGMKSNKDLVGTHLLILWTVVLVQWRDKESEKLCVLIVNPTEQFLGTRLVMTILHFCSILFFKQCPQLKGRSTCNAFRGCSLLQKDGEVGTVVLLHCSPASVGSSISVPPFLAVKC